MFRVLTAAACFALCACAPEARKVETPPAAVVEAEPAPVVDPAGTVETSLPSLTKAAEPGSVLVSSPTVGARLTSPFTLEGTAINTFFFEGVFPVELVANGLVIARAQAQQAGDKAWTDPGQIGFTSTLTFEVTAETNAELVLSEDMPEYIDEANDIRGPARSVKIPVVLVPPAK